MRFLEAVRGFLSEHPDIPFLEEAEQITVRPTGETGFEVSITDYVSGGRVHYNLWHEEFEDPKNALKCFRLGLSERCRIIETRFGRDACKVKAEWFDEGKWHDLGTTGLMLFPFWKRKTVVTLQNHFLRDYDA